MITGCKVTGIIRADHLRDFGKWFHLRLYRLSCKPRLWALLLFLRTVWEPFCWLAGRRRWFKSQENIRRILFIALDYRGDTLLATPSLTALKERFPSAEITVLAGEWSRELLLTNPAISKIITYNAPWHKSSVTHLRHRPFQHLRDFLKIIGHLWREQFDLAVDTCGEAAHILLAYLSGAPYRVGYAIRSFVPWLKFEKLAPFLTHRVPYAWDRWLEWHRVDYNLHVVACLGAVPKNSSLVLDISPSAHERIRYFLEREGVRDVAHQVGRR